MLKPKNSTVEPQVQEPVVDEGNAQGGAEKQPKLTKSGRVRDEAKIAFTKGVKEAGKALKDEEDKEGLVKGEGRENIGFVTCLGNPQNMGTRTENGEEGIPVPEVVGFKLKALADIKVPVTERVNIPKNNPMGYSSIEWVDVKAGTEFDVNTAELAELLKLPEYDGMFTGHAIEDQYGTPVEAEIHMTTSKTGGTYRVNVSLKRVKYADDRKYKPLKAMYVEIATPKEGASKDSKSISDWQVKPEYAEKFGYLYEKAPARVGGGSTKAPRKPGENAAELAAALRAMTNKA